MLDQCKNSTVLGALFSMVSSHPLSLLRQPFTSWQKNIKGAVSNIVLPGFEEGTNAEAEEEIESDILATLVFLDMEKFSMQILLSLRVSTVLFDKELHNSEY